MGYSDCFFDRNTTHTIFGEKINSEGIALNWFAERKVAYYALVSLLLGISCVVIPLWLPKHGRSTLPYKSAHVWQLSIVLVAVCSCISGVTRFTMFFAVLHNYSGITKSQNPLKL